MFTTFLSYRNNGRERIYIAITYTTRGWPNRGGLRQHRHDTVINVKNTVSTSTKPASKAFLTGTGCVSIDIPLFMFLPPEVKVNRVNTDNLGCGVHS